MWHSQYGYAIYYHSIGKIGIAKLSHIINFTNLALAFPMFNRIVLVLFVVLMGK